MNKNKLKDSAIIGASAAVGSGVSSYLTAGLLAREEEETGAAEAPESEDAGRDEPSARVDTANAAMEPSSEAQVHVLTVEPVGPAEQEEPVSPVEPAEPVGPAVAAVHPEDPVEDQEVNALISEIEIIYGGPEIDENPIAIDIDSDTYGGPVDEIYPLGEDDIYS